MASTSHLALRHGDGIALRGDTLQLTYRQLDAWAGSVAEQLSSRGVGRGDVVAIALPNRCELLVVMLAAWRIGAVVTPVNPGLTSREAQHQLGDSGAVLMVCEPSNQWECDVPGLGVDELDRDGVQRRAEDVGEDELALIVYTSGSTGSPKGVMLDHGNVAAMVSIMGNHLSLEPRDHTLVVLPLFHVNAIMVSALPVLCAGGQVSVVGSFSLSRFFDQVEQLRPTFFSAVPAIYAMLSTLPETVVPDLSSLRFAACGAAPLSEELLARTYERFGLRIVEGYGLTETTAVSTCNPLDGVRKVGTTGPALPGLRVEIMVDGVLQPAGVRGEVVIAGPTVMRGYLGRPVETAAVLVDGWLHTGDIGTLDDDGYLSIVDRAKDMIIRGGENIYPKEIESVISSLDDVVEVAVVGRVSSVLGEEPVALVTVRPGRELSPEAIIAHCQARLARYKVPVAVRVIDDLPRSATGKINKPAIRAMWRTSD